MDSYTDFAPIAARATPPGESALAVIRISGGGNALGDASDCGALKLLEKCFSRPAVLRAAQGNSVVYGWMIDGAEKVDEVLISVYRAPKSYTGEDGADICCHGGDAAPRAVLNLLLKNGFRQALRGEFSYRAFINGKVDLSRAEAVMEIVGAKGERALAGSVRRLSGALEAEINAVKKLLLDVVCEVELNLDYSEVDGVGSEDAGLPAKESVLAALSRLDHLLALYQTVKLEKEGALVALVGRPNAGKSSLFNLLLKEERSIVTEIPGTTRDWIEGWIEIDGIPVRLADTAGIHEAADKIEQIGIERSAALATSADFVLTIIDGADANPPKPPLQMPGSGLLVWNKCDLNPMPDNFCLDGKRCIAVSAKTGAGLPALVKAIAKELRHLAGSAEEGAAAASTGDAPGTDRQRSLIASAKTALQETLALSDNNAPLDIIAPRLRDALDALGEITGEVSNAGILEAMFGNFCVGK